MVTAAGGASEIVHTATFMIGQELLVVALFDSDDAGRREEEKLRTKWLTRYKNHRSATLLLGDSAGVQTRDFTIEDLFPDEYYLAKVRESHAPKLGALGKSDSDLSLAGAGPILPRVLAACDALGVQFNKGSVAKLIRKDLVRITALKDLPTGTAEKARALLAAIRKAFVQPPR
jgi:hypothetical protein